MPVACPRAAGSSRRSRAAELRRRHARAGHPLGRDVAVLDRQAAERPAQRVDRQAEIEQRAEDHVARRARETVEIQRLRQLEHSFFPEAVVPHVGQNDVVDHVDPHQHPGGRPAAASAPRRRRSASDRQRDDCGTARSPPRRPPAAARKTSRGWTMLASSVPTDSTRRPQDPVLRVEQQRRRTARPAGCRTAAPGTRRPSRAPICTRSRRARTSVRRPSSTAARICAARARADARHAPAGRR